jgi:hypothetical protein
VTAGTRRAAGEAVGSGKLVKELKDPYGDLQPHNGLRLRKDALLGVGSYRSSTTFLKIELVEFGEKGKRTARDTRLTQLAIHGTGYFGLKEVRTGSSPVKCGLRFWPLRLKKACFGAEVGPSTAPEICAYRFL